MSSIITQIDPQRIYSIKIHDVEGSLLFNNLFYADDDVDAAMAGDIFAAWYASEEGYSVSVKICLEGVYESYLKIPAHVNDEYASLYDWYVDLSVEFTRIWTML